MSGDDIRGVEFHQKLRGYDPGEVDAHLEQLARIFDEGRRPQASDVMQAGFRTRLRGYNPQEVDDFLKRVVTESR